MLLPGSKFQDHHWEEIKELLSELSLSAFGDADSLIEKMVGADADAKEQTLEAYHDRIIELLGPMYERARGKRCVGNVGDTVASLAVSLVYDLDRVGKGRHFLAFLKALRRSHATHGRFWETDKRDAYLHKMINNMYSELRDVVDWENYVVACGRKPPYDYIKVCRIVEQAYRKVEKIFSEGTDLKLIGAILGREVRATPLETRMKSKRDCRPEWLINWSAVTKGPFHTRAHWIAPYRNDPRKIRAILIEMADCEEGLDQIDDPRFGAPGTGANVEEETWGDELARVGADVEQDGDGETPDENEEGEEISAPPCMGLDSTSRQEAVTRCLEPLAEPVRLAIYLDKLKGLEDAIFPDELIDKETGNLVTLAQLAKAAGVNDLTFREMRARAFADFLACIKKALPRLAGR